MSRIRPLDQDQAHPDAQPFYEQDLRVFGVVLNPTRILAHTPQILASTRALRRSLDKGGVLPAGLRALVSLRVAMLIGCPF